MTQGTTAGARLTITCFLYQAVHMIFNGDFDESWTEGETRQSKLVFIGKNLDHAELKAAFAACAVTEDTKTKKLKNLRFGVGDSVACNTGGSFQKGTVISQMYREEGMPPGMVAPYQVKLDNESLIYVPEDTEGFVKKA